MVLENAEACGAKVIYFDDYDGMSLGITLWKPKDKNIQGFLRVVLFNKFINKCIDLDLYSSSYVILDGVNYSELLSNEMTYVNNIIKNKWNIIRGEFNLVCEENCMYDRFKCDVFNSIIKLPDTAPDYSLLFKGGL